MYQARVGFKTRGQLKLLLITMPGNSSLEMFLWYSRNRRTGISFFVIADRHTKLIQVITLLETFAPHFPSMFLTIGSIHLGFTIFLYWTLVHSSRTRSPRRCAGYSVKALRLPCISFPSVLPNRKLQQHQGRALASLLCQTPLKSDPNRTTTNIIVQRPKIWLNRNGPI